MLDGEKEIVQWVEVCRRVVCSFIFVFKAHQECWGPNCKQLTKLPKMLNEYEGPNSVGRRSGWVIHGWDGENARFALNVHALACWKTPSMRDEKAL
jgi:hypothetical protein